METCGNPGCPCHKVNAISSDATDDEFVDELTGKLVGMRRSDAHATILMIHNEILRRMEKRIEELERQVGVLSRALTGVYERLCELEK